MKQLDLANVKESSDEGARLPVGGYVARIIQVNDNTEKEYLEIQYDIAEGEFKDYYKQLFASRSFWGGKLYRSYKQSALPFFKGFITTIERSNPNFSFNFNEKTLQGKEFGLVLSEEEYRASDGSVKTRLYASSVRSIDSIRKGDFKVKELKKLEVGAIPQGTVEIEDTVKLPF